MILRLQQDSVEIIAENLAFISQSLKEAGAEFVSIVAVMGTYRTGKSFLLDLLMRSLKARADKEVANATEEDPKSARRSNNAPSRYPLWRLGHKARQKRTRPAWISEGGPAISEGCQTQSNPSAFPWRSGMERCTNGIWLWSSPHILKDKNGRRVAVLLMDTQGAWDDVMTKAQSASIFGLTALLSSKLIYNIQNRVEEDKLENLDYITTFAQTVCKDLPRETAPFGHLELLVRDWANYEDGWTMEKCRDQMAKHLDDHLHPNNVPLDAIDRCERLRSVFKTIGCSGFVHPGLKVTSSKFRGELDVIDSDFVILLDEFIERLFGGDFPEPSAPLGCEITVDRFQQIVSNFAEIFRKGAKEMAIGMREAFVKIEMITLRDSMVRKFREGLASLAPIFSVVDPVYFREESAKLQQTYLDDFVAHLKPWRLNDSDEKACVSEFMQTISEAADARTQQNERQVDGATLKLVLSPIVGLAGYFVLAHHLILYGVILVGGYCHAKKWSVRKEVDMFDAQVAQGMYEDAKKWAIQRWTDIQAMYIALQRFKPTDAMTQLSKVVESNGKQAQDGITFIERKNWENAIKP